MLAAIGLILILKQIPHALGYDFVYEGDFSFTQTTKHNTFTDILFAILEPQPLAIIISVVSLITMVLWDNTFKHKIAALKVIPGALLAVFAGVIINNLALTFWAESALNTEHLVKLPLNILSGSGKDIFESPDFEVLKHGQVYIVAITIALIASIETLLSIEASDKLDPKMRITPLNKELIAQGIGNTLLGFIGGIPATAVIVRSSANIIAGAASKLSAIIHGILLIISVVALAPLLNQIPLASLAAILLVVGFKLASPKLFKQIFLQGYSQFIPFAITIVAIIFTDLLKGIGIGLAIGILFMIFSNIKSAVKVTRYNNLVLIRLRNNVTFLNKYHLRNELRKIEPGAEVIIDLRPASFIDHDIAETLEQFIFSARHNKLKLEIKKTPRQMGNKKFKGLDNEFM
jgi:MFS superfamily sulfate permease-like transporter